MRDVIERRVTPFLDNIGLGKPITHVMGEAYIQGMRDALECIQTPEPARHLSDKPEVIEGCECRICRLHRAQAEDEA
jgi:hypothetical protein